MIVTNMQEGVIIDGICGLINYVRYLAVEGALGIRIVITKPKYRVVPKTALQKYELRIGLLLAIV